MKKIIISLLVVCAGVMTYGQDKTTWKNKKCAIALTYDDALAIDLDNVIPVLDSLGLKGTFYLSCAYPGFRERITDWKKAAQKGHELANHSLFHPCNGNMPGREWVKPEYNLANYTLQRMREELRVTNTMLEAVDGKTKRTFAYPCGDTKIGDSLYLDKKDFVAARGVKQEMMNIDQVDLYNVGCYAIDGQSGDELIALAKKAIESHTLLVFLFHGVGGGHPINVSLEAHRQLVYFLKEHEKEIWIAPFIDITEYVKAQTKKP
ncbi:MAG: polysaccharide deacetylase family protein [Bacteroidota bacterium]